MAEIRHQSSIRTVMARIPGFEKNPSELSRLRSDRVMSQGMFSPRDPHATSKVDIAEEHAQRIEPLVHGRGQKVCGLGFSDFRADSDGCRDERNAD